MKINNIYWSRRGEISNMPGDTFLFINLDGGHLSELEAKKLEDAIRKVIEKFDGKIQSGDSGGKPVVYRRGRS